MKSKFAIVAIAAFAATGAVADGKGMKHGVTAVDQDVSNGIVSAREIAAARNGWLVVHRTDAAMKPGPVVGHAPIRAGTTSDVAAILTEPVQPGERLMLMVHGEMGGMEAGVFEYTLGAKEDGPVRVDGDLVMKVITAE